MTAIIPTVVIGGFLYVAMALSIKHRTLSEGTCMDSVAIQAWGQVEEEHYMQSRQTLRVMMGQMARDGHCPEV